MSTKVKKRRDFLIAFRAFFITVVCCLLVFLIVATAVLYRGEKTKDETEDSPAASKQEMSSVLIIYEGTTGIKFASITFNWNEPSYSCSEVPDRMVEFENEADTLSRFLSRKGLTGLMNAYNSFAATPAAGYLVFSSESLIKIVNRFGGLEGDENLRITGTQAAKAAESGKIEEVFSKLCERFFSKYGSLSLKNRFLYLISVNESNLSYTQFCKVQNYLEKMT